MSRRRYSVKESLNRILLALLGTPMTDDTPDILVLRPVLSEDEAFSDLAELMQDSLPGETLFVPDAMSHRFGQIYAESVTGTSQSLITGTWTVVTDFSADGLSSDEITPDYANNRIVITQAGTYFVAFDLSLSSPAGTATMWHLEAAFSGVRQHAVSSKVELGSSLLAARSVGSSGFVNIATVPSSGTYVNLHILSRDADRVFHKHEVQVSVEKVA